MKHIFVTVGTTSFDPFVESLCSLPFLTATLQKNISTGRPPSAQSASSSQSTSDPQLLSPSCEIHRSSKFSHSILSCLEFSPHSSSTDMNHEMIKESVEIVIQYGRGKCPLHFLPPEIRSIWSESGAVGHDDEGTVTTSVKFQDQGTTKHGTLHIKWYRFKPSLSTDMEWADLLLCHSGAGTLIEALSLTQASPSSPKTITTSETSRTAHRVINAVINSQLMDNHQSELAEELEKRNHILVTRKVKDWATLSGAQKFWDGVNDFVPKHFVGGSMSQVEPSSVATVSNFQRIVDRVMGI